MPAQTQTQYSAEEFAEDVLFSLSEEFPDQVGLNIESKEYNAQEDISPPISESKVYEIHRQGFILKMPLLSLAEADGKYHIVIQSKKHREKIREAVLKSAKENGLEASVNFLN